MAGVVPKRPLALLSGAKTCKEKVEVSDKAMHRMKRTTLRISTICGILLTALSLPVTLRAADLIPPSAPSGLIAKVATCGQVDLSWNASTDEAGGSGLHAYIIQRSDGSSTSIGTGRTTFSDVQYVKSSTTLGYTIVAQDIAGNRSAASNVETVITPACPSSSYEQIIGDAAGEPFGKSIATYGTR